MDKSGTSSCETQEPIMADDGSGQVVSVPSFLMFKLDADLAKAELKANHLIQMEMAWSLPRPDGHVEYDLWTTPSDTVSRDFLRTFKWVAASLKGRAYFTPHMYIYDGGKSQCKGTSGENFCYNLCTNKGRYCATDPGNDFKAGISGADVVRETLRRLCIWDIYGAANGVGMEWWDYVTTLDDRCVASANFFKDLACISDAYKVAKIDGKAVEGCMKDSGGTEGDNSNSILDRELQAQGQWGVVAIPSAVVNMAAIRVALNANNVFQAICSGYMEGMLPPLCAICSRCPDVVGCVTSGVQCSGKFISNRV
jgi:hypothetical protein